MIFNKSITHNLKKLAKKIKVPKYVELEEITRMP